MAPNLGARDNAYGGRFVESFHVFPVTCHAECVVIHERAAKGF